MGKYAVVFLTAAALFLPHTGVTAAQDASYVVIVHRDNPTDSLPRKKVSRLLLKEISTWDGGLSAQPVDLDSKSPVRSAFSRDVHGRSVSSIKNFWQRQIFSGEGVPPPEVADDAAVIAFVRSNPGGIGYVSAQARLDGGVKVLDIASK